MANEYLNNRTFESIIQSFQHYKRQKARFELVVADLRETHERRVVKYQDDARRAALAEAEAGYEAACEGYRDYQQQLAYAFYVLAENIANYAKFSGIEIDDAIQEGVLICFEKVDRFNPDYKGKSGQKAKAFNYMTTCILNHFRQMYRGARNYSELKRKYHIHLQERFEGAVFRNGRERAAARSGIDRDTPLW